MTLERACEVDAVGLDRRTGSVVLTVVDDVDWSDEQHHLSLLETKLNAYLAFMESGELDRKYPDARGRELVIQVVARHALPPAGQEFLGKARQVLERSGYGLEHKLLGP